jgi:hypothetical protein
VSWTVHGDPGAQPAGEPYELLGTIGMLDCGVLVGGAVSLKLETGKDQARCTGAPAPAGPSSSMPRTRQ